MKIEKYTKILESILFSSEEPLSIKKIAELMELTTKDVRKIAEELEQYYINEERGVLLYSFDGTLQLGTNTLYESYLQKMVKTTKSRGLSDSALEVLSIVAYKQPITKNEIEHMRGVKSDYAIRSLIDRGLIDEIGRLDKIGKPIIYGTTKTFLRNFSLDSIGQLPKIDEAVKEL